MIPSSESAEPCPPGRAYEVLKRAADILFSGMCLVASSPLLAFIAILVRATSPGPAIFRQPRVGRQGKLFRICKFRTMRDGAENLGPAITSSEDLRITRIGRILRSSKLDELPQLWNVLCGDMSLVGPRPERPEFVRDFERDIQGYAERFKVRPGLTGYAQVNGEYHTSPATKLKYDLAYIYNRSLWLDVRILADTVKVMLTRRGV